MGRKIRLAGIAYESLVNGPGMRRVCFSPGCNHNCTGGVERDMDELIEDTISNPMLKGVTFSGGDPLERAEDFAYMAEAFKNKNLNIWCYTGYKFEDIINNLDNNKGWKHLLSNIDVLVDGKFEKDKMQDGLKFRGSTNQRIIDVPNSLESGKVITLKY